MPGHAKIAARTQSSFAPDFAARSPNKARDDCSASTHPYCGRWYGTHESILQERCLESTNNTFVDAFWSLKDASILTHHVFFNCKETHFFASGRVPQADHPILPEPFGITDEVISTYWPHPATIRYILCDYLTIHWWRWPFSLSKFDRFLEVQLRHHSLDINKGDRPKGPKIPSWNRSTH